MPATNMLAKWDLCRQILQTVQSHKTPETEHGPVEKKMFWGNLLGPLCLQASYTAGSVGVAVMPLDWVTQLNSSYKRNQP